MITCKECNQVLERITWTHLRNNCTGKFKNAKEYKKAYPNEPIISKELSKKTAITLENLIKKYGEEGPLKWEEYKKKQAYSNSYEFKKDKYGWTLDKFTDFNKSRACTLSNFVKRHGEEKGIQLWNEYCDRQKYTNTLEYFIEKYGNEGKDIWERYCIERSKSSNIEFVSQKYNLSKEEALELISSRKKGSHISNGERIFVDFIEEQLKLEFEYSYKTKQYSLYNVDSKTLYMYDIVLKKNKKIIEYNGDYWHCNPTMYESTYYHKHIKRTAEEIWRFDEEKVKCAMNNSFDVLIVCESEFKEKPDGILKKIKEYLNV